MAERDEQILRAALETIGRYGYRRTTMADIGRASGVPRTALYRLYDSKEHIFLALIERVHNEAIRAAETALEADEPFTLRLENALIARDRHLLAIGHTGPHADEIAEVYQSIGKELVAATNRRLVSVLKKATNQAIVAGEFLLPNAYENTGDFVTILRLGLEGVKKEVKSPKRFETLARQLLGALID